MAEKITNFEQALAELESIVKKLEAAQENLETSIALYERGVMLKKFCEDKLKEATLKIEKISLGADQSVKTEEISGFA